MTSPLTAPAAALAALLAMAAPAQAQQPEVWLKPKGGGPWTQNEIMFSMTCQKVAAQMPSGIYTHPDNTPVQTGSDTSVTHNPASSVFQVEGRNIGRYEPDDAPLPEDHPGRAFGNETWSDLCQGPFCGGEPKYELTIRLVATADASAQYIKDNLHLGGLVNQRGKTITVTRVWNTSAFDKYVPVGAFCPSGSSETFNVTVTATIMSKRRL